MPDYQTNDPKGWGGDPKRGAALGRRDRDADDPELLTGRMTLRKVKMCSCCGAYDENGNYWGAAIRGVQPLYWAAYDEGDFDVDMTFRASDRDAAKDHVRKTYPNAKFFN